MKKFFVSAFVFLVVSANLCAQVQVGVRAGVHESSKGSSGGGFVPGFTVAVPVHVPLTNSWGIRLEPSFVQKGWQTKVDYTTDLGQPAGTGDMRIRYGVAELPLLLSFRKGGPNRLAYYAVAGPSVGYVLGGKLKITKDNAELLRDEVRFENRLAVGVAGGGGIEMPLGRVRTFLDVRYQYELSRNDPFKYRGAMHGFTVSVGCWLPTKK